MTYVCCLAQNNTFPASGNVGIGITNPGARLSFNNLNDGSNGADGITWYNPQPLSYGIFKSAGSWDGPNFQQLILNFETGIVLNPGIFYGKSYVDVQGGGLRVSSGSIGIGTTDTQGYKLAVNGNIRAKEVKVENSNWPDYVFEQHYQATSLAEIEKFIKLNKHLEGIPSAKEVHANGVNLSEMNALLLKKIEELTLIVIDQNKRIEKLEAK